ncbi:YdeI/OmpD-associated family protein [Nocardia sp. NPDC059764]|uniref:YdeI/OmpD-associated family protein n=1 Tax=Nocardia sp. NPDC059764 TaxID=3346939 RepID=UPI0036610E2B
MKFRAIVEPPEPMRGLEVPFEVVEALDAAPLARAAYDNLSHSRKREHVHVIESAKKPETRQRRIEKAIATLRG